LFMSPVNIMELCTNIQFKI